MISSVSLLGSGEALDPRLAMALVLGGAVALGFWVSGALQRALHRKVKGGELDVGTAGRLAAFFNYGLMGAGALLALQVTGIDLGGLFAAGAILAVGLGFALQDIVQNFVSGLIVLGERQIREGDILEIDGLVVRVLRLGIRTALVETRDGVEIIVPNGTLAQSSIRNFTLHEPEYRIRTTVGVAYDSDPVLVRQALMEVGTRCPGRLPAMPPRALLIEFANSSVNWELAVWVADPWDARFLLSGVNEDIWTTFRARGISIAFPQLDLHLPREMSGLGPKASPGGPS